MQDVPAYDERDGGGATAAAPLVRAPIAVDSVGLIPHLFLFERGDSSLTFEDESPVSGRAGLQRGIASAECVTFEICRCPLFISADMPPRRAARPTGPAIGQPVIAEQSALLIALAQSSREVYLPSS